MSIARGLLLTIGLLLVACTPERDAPAAAVEPVPATGQAADDRDAATPSASLAGVAEDADIEPPATDPGMLVLPGPFSRDTSLADLESRFGTANVKVTELPGAEGETYRGVLLYPDDPSRRAYVTFHDEKAMRSLARVAVEETGSRWTLDNGVRTRMSFADLRRINGKPFRFYGFDWDYGGSVDSWNGGSMGADNAAMTRGVRLDLRDPPQRPAEAVYPVGDRDFSSDDPRYPQLGRIAYVSEIFVHTASDVE
ncbi:MAG TPA: hypothetical protein VNI56_05215 [Xanthomonadaceae bacterium]|nr:hypothetical protein [Xanthomonadaceae bacterium]